MKTVDVVVVGGGPAGSATALGLARVGARVALYESSDYDQLRMGETLPPSVNPLLRELGVWEQFTALGSLPSYQTASAWGASLVSQRSFLFSPHGNGWHVDRARFDAMLAQAAADAGVRVLRGVRARHIERSSGGFEIEASEPVHASMLVEASGRAARFGRGLGGKRAQLDRLVCAARVFLTRPSEPLGDTFLEAVASGWWYASPLPGGHRIVACFTDARNAAQDRLRTPSGWAAAVAATRHIRHLTDRCPIGEVRVISAASHQLRPCAGPGWVAVGDAALAVDPLSSGGVTFALRTATAATNALMNDHHTDYLELVDNSATEYRKLRAEIYSWEPRFTCMPFWRDRSDPAEPEVRSAPDHRNLRRGRLAPT
ncbi:tryptophan 7-halogenase [Nocardia vinacea]|uniref:NAD(P)/FAD-dependent oxidoreductase n=1 Tax=Nocardia vinacea TaxID=96468 RepID=UPI002E0EC020|nr:tryptophan 7-halogenase [Nocardia vinacea]